MKSNNVKLGLAVGIAAASTLITTSAFAWGTITTMPNAFGGQNFFSSSSGFIGSSMPNAFGGMNYSFRGKDGASTLFTDKDIGTKAESDKIAAALESRDVDTLTSCAWDLKGLETILGKKDKKTNSELLFAAAAQMAVEQGNADGLKAIVALAPECKKYQDALSLRGKTRGVGAAPLCALPQVVRVGGADWKEEVKTLAPWQTPMLDKVTLCGSFRGMTEADAELCSSMINGGRVAMRPLAMATGAVQLSSYKTSDECCEKMKPANIFKEAVELAVFKSDLKTVKQLSELYKTTGFADPEYARYLNEVTSMCVASRGQLTDEEANDAVATALLVLIRELADKSLD